MLTSRKSDDVWVLFVYNGTEKMPIGAYDSIHLAARVASLLGIAVSIEPLNKNSIALRNVLITETPNWMYNVY